MEKEENIIIPRWFLERIEDTLRIQHNINLDKKGGETCQDRNIKESLNGVRKLLKGDELTGSERLEKLQPPLPSNLDKEFLKYTESAKYPPADQYQERLAYEAFKAGAKRCDAQIPKLLNNLDEAAEENAKSIHTDWIKTICVENFKFGAEWMANQITNHKTE